MPHMKRTVVLGALMVVGALSGAARGYQAQQAHPPLPDIQKVRDNLYVITGSSATDRPNFTGGNTGVLVTDAGVVVVDTKLPGYGQDILAKIKTVTDKPVTLIINTHAHADHTGSNVDFPATAEIVMHENAKPYVKVQPKRTYRDTLSLTIGKYRIDLYHFGPGHTNGDTFVVFPALRVMHAGDMFPWKDAPFLDRSIGGSGVEFPKTLAKAIAGIKNVDTVIPGHYPLTTWSDFQEFQRFNAELLATVESAIKAGKSVEEATAAANLTKKYKGYATDRLQAAVEAIYAELKK